MDHQGGLDKTAKTDRRAVSEAIRQSDTTEGPAEFFPGGRVKFLKNGRGDGAVFVIAQWQNGEPITVYPPASALKDPVWPKRTGQLHEKHAKKLPRSEMPIAMELKLRPHDTTACAYAFQNNPPRSPFCEPSGRA